MTSTAPNKPPAITETDKRTESEQKSQTRSHIRPCERCRSQHLKCVYESEKCRRCERSGAECVQITKNFRFRGVQISKLRREHKKSNQNGSTIDHVVPKGTSQDSQAETNGRREAKNPDLSLPERKAHQDGLAVGVQALPQLDWQAHLNTTDSPIRSETSRNGFQDPVSPTEKADAQPEFLSPPRRPMSSGQGGHSDSTGLAQVHCAWASVMSLDSLPAPSSSPQMSSVRSAPSNLLDQLVKFPTRGTKNTSLDYLETVLLRYFHEELAQWFDLCDPDRHFATVVPRKAREPGPLRSALLTISARNLARNTRFRNARGVPEWAGHPLPELREELAMAYHNDCIRNLLQMSMDPRRLQDETLLAAVIALRTDEELSSDTSDDYGGNDQQLFLKILSVFIDAQVPASICLPHSSPEVFPTLFEEHRGSMNEVSFGISPHIPHHSASPLNHTDTDLGSNGLRQACFWTAFRQELHASFLRQQAVRFPLTRCEAFRQLSPAIDAVWANRMVTFCADVLEFCYGSSCADGMVAPAYTNQARWIELRNHERNLCAMLPASFEPTYCSESNATPGVIFPEIWYQEACHVSGTTYIELARMLLEAFNPNRPKLGHGFLAATNAFVASTKKILFRLCGIALSNYRFCPPSLINACLGISMFGEYFEDRVEQDALLGVLALISSRHAYPTHHIANSLRSAWSANEESSDGPT